MNALTFWPVCSVTMYITGTTSNVNTVPTVSPPMTDRAIGAQLSRFATQECNRPDRVTPSSAPRSRRPAFQPHNNHPLL